MKIVVILFLVCSCSVFKIKDKTRFSNVNQEVLQYVKTFEWYKKSTVKKLVIEFSDDFSHMNPSRGKCLPAKATIKINTLMWEEASDIEREMLVFHELGHCDLEREHDSSKSRIGRCPGSIMYWQGVSPNCYERYKERYIKELFGRK